MDWPKLKYTSWKLKFSKMNNKKFQIIFALLLLVCPALSSAAFPGVTTLINDFNALAQNMIIIISSLAMLFFVWNMSQVILNAADSKAKEDHRRKMIWGIVAMFVMFSLWGIIAWLGDNFEINAGGPGSGAFEPCLDPQDEAPGC